MNIWNKLYPFALFILKKVNCNERSYVTELDELDRLTYQSGNHAYLTYGMNNEWQHVSRYEVLDNAIQKLDEYENINHMSDLKEILKGYKYVRTTDGKYYMKDIITEDLEKQYAYEIATNCTVDWIINRISELDI